MEREAKRAAKLEQKAAILTGGLAGRLDKLRGEAEEAWRALQGAVVELECFRWEGGPASWLVDGTNYSDHSFKCWRDQGIDPSIDCWMVYVVDIYGSGEAAGCWPGKGWRGSCSA